MTATDFAMPRYSLHGLCVESETPLVAVLAEDREPPDVRIMAWQVEATRFDALAGALAEAPRLIDRVFPILGDGPEMRAITIDHAGNWLTLLFDRVLFQLDRKRGELHRYVRTPDDIAFGDMLQAGSYWATVCTLRGRIAHHCSAVDIDELGGTVLIAARSGQGKSSTAASLVLAGGKLRSDDVVTLQANGTRFLCESGSLALRMRKPIVSALPNALRAYDKESGDQRHLYFGTASIAATSPVLAVLFSQLEGENTPTTLDPIGALDGFKRLAQEPRVGGVQDQAYQTARVAELTALCGRTPLRVARMPMPGRDLAAQGRVLIDLMKRDAEIKPA